MTERAVVADGDPCPIAGHEGAPTRLLYLGDFGTTAIWVSQCAYCIEDFFAWYGSQPPGVPGLIEAPSQLITPQLELGELAHA